MNGSALYLILESSGSPCTCRAIRRVWSMSSSGARVVERSVRKAIPRKINTRITVRRCIVFINRHVRYAKQP